MFHNQSRTDSTPSRGTIPQGKGREGIRKGKGEWLSFSSMTSGSWGDGSEKRMAADAARIRGVR